MFDESYLDKQLNIVVERQEKINNDIIAVITKRINEIGNVSVSDIHRLQQLYMTGVDVREINQILAIGTAMQVKDIQKIIRDVAEMTLYDAKPYYDYRHKPFIPYDKNKPVRRIVQAISKETANSFKNISNSKATGFVLRDRKNPMGKRVFMNMEKSYQDIIDEAIQSISMGTETYNVLMRRTILQLVKSGIQGMAWDSGYHQRLDTAIRRNILDGAKRVSMEVDSLIGEEIGADGVCLSAHTMSAPDHEPIQGHCFKKEEYEKLQNTQDFVDINGNKFLAIKRAIGEWNCRHFPSSVILATYVPLYTQEQLDKMRSDNHKGYTLPNGKHYTLYECTQIQRRLETECRRYKEAQMAFLESGDIDNAKKYQAKAVQKAKECKAFCSACGIQYLSNRLRVSGYKMI